ncbi:hypothetical protein N0V83_003185 [Neocucurbitaria cava]|uniref:Uncharacterized protein n=1 Tax=Neocucurbitaria cava TaxID=798079 RepID=A0A9W8YB79_9PLEO|nr:hypothetical protein N0V83_003185 [Neocucurbitaria cava]
MDASTSLFEKRIHNRRQTSPERKVPPRKNPSISLAAGLIMNAESPKSTGPLSSPRKQSRDRILEGANEDQAEAGSLFYAYALRSDYPNSPPCILAFASPAVCSQWWALVQHEYHDSARPSPQLFVLKSEDMEHIQNDPKFFKLRHKWFYMPQDSPMTQACIIPVQNAYTHHAILPQHPTEEKPVVPAMDSLLEKLGRLSNMVETNADQIHALSAAQSVGLQAMQEINESNSTQIKAIADSQIKLQALVDQNASHYIALANTSFQSQEKIKDIMKTTASQIHSLSKNQAQLANTCDSMMRAIDNLSTSVSQMALNTALSDTASTSSLNAIADRISPGPRKLNRRVKGVWYEYDTTSTPTGSPRRSVNFVDTPPKSPVTLKNTLKNT